MALVPSTTQEVGLETLRGKARAFAENSRSSSTVRAYESDLRSFRAWCDERGLLCLPASPQTVSIYVAEMAEQYKPSTLERRLAAISTLHKNAGYENPVEHAVVKSVWRGVRRQVGVKQTRKRALMVEDLKRVIKMVDVRRMIGKRDASLLILGFASALRRGELVAINVEDVRFEREGIVLSLRRSKTNQEGNDEEVAVLYGSDPATCPVRLLQAWLDATGITSGPVFRHVDRHGNVRGNNHLTERIVAKVVKQYTKAVGFDPADFAGHSLRSGFATSAARAGKSEASIMRQTRHKSVQVARRYIHQGTRWEDHAQAGIGL